MRKALSVLIFVILTATPAFAVTERVVSVRPDCSGHSNCYTSLQDAVARESKNLVRLDRQLTIECYPMEDTAAVLIEGFTTDATHYVKVTVPVGYRHHGTYTASSYRLEASAEHLLDNRSDYTVIEWLQLYNTRTTPGWYAVANNYNNGNTGAVWRYNIVKANPETAGTPIGFQVYGQNAKIYRNIIYDTRAIPSYGNDYGYGYGYGIYAHADHEIYQNTIFHTHTGIDCAGNAATLRQNYVGSCNYAYLNVENATHSKNISADPSSPDGAQYQEKNAYSDYFVDYTHRDFHLKATDTVLKDAGDDLGSPYDYDIDGERVTGKWDIGADEQRPSESAAALRPDRRGYSDWHASLSGAVFGESGDLLSLNGQLIIEATARKALGLVMRTRLGVCSTAPLTAQMHIRKVIKACKSSI